MSPLAAGLGANLSGTGTSTLVHSGWHRVLKVPGGKLWHKKLRLEVDGCHALTMRISITKRQGMRLSGRALLPSVCKSSTLGKKGVGVGLRQATLRESEASPDYIASSRPARTT